MSGFSMFPPGMKFLLASNIGVYLAELLFGAFHFSGGMPFTEWVELHFSLWPLGSSNFMPWQLVTYMFLHEGFWHIFMNMLWLFWTGALVEQVWGTRKFLIYYLICGLGGAATNMLLSSAVGLPSGPMLGASAAIFGVLVAFGVLYPDMRLFIFPFPIPIKAKLLVPIMIGIEVISMWSPDNVAHLAHLGGAVTGMIYLLVISGGKLLSGRRNAAQYSQWGNSSGPAVRDSGGMFGRVKKKREAVDAEYHDIDSVHHSGSNTNAQNVKQGKVITQEEIDRILDKIAATGYQNLTEDERDILFEASRRMDEKR